MNERIKKLVKQAGGEFWQRIESDGVLNKEAYITFDPPQSLEKFAELIMRECAEAAARAVKSDTDKIYYFESVMKSHFGVEE